MVTGYKLKEEIVQQMARNAATAAAEAAAAAPAAAPAAPTPNNTEFRMTLKGGIVVEKL